MSSCFAKRRGAYLERSLSAMQTYYAARAGEYDAVYEKPERQADLRRIERWLPSTMSGQRVLEVACGTGYWTQFLAPVALSIVAVDSSAETLRIAKRRVPHNTVLFEVGDAYALKHHGGLFGAAFAGFWFSHVPLDRQGEFLRGLNEVLEPGAKVVLLDNRFVEGSSSAISEQDPAGNTYQSRKLGNGSTHRVLKNFPTEAQLLALIESGLGQSAVYTCWSFFWALEYRVPEA